MAAGGDVGEVMVVGVGGDDAETFLFHRGVKTADDTAARVAPLGSLIVGGEDGAAGATGGAEQRCLTQGEKIEIAECGQPWRRACAKTHSELARPTRIGGVNAIRSIHGAVGGLVSFNFFCSALSRISSRLSTFLMFSATGRFSGIVPPSS